MAWSVPWMRTSIVLPTSPASAPSMRPMPSLPSPKTGSPPTSQRPVHVDAFLTYFVLTARVQALTVALPATPECWSAYFEKPP